MSGDRRGASDEEIAAAVVALIASLAASAPAPAEPAHRSAWASPGSRLGSAYGPRPGGWRQSGLPR